MIYRTNQNSEVLNTLNLKTDLGKPDCSYQLNLPFRLGIGKTHLACPLLCIVLSMEEFVLYKLKVEVSVAILL